MGTLIFFCSLVIYRHYDCEVFTNILKVMTILINLYKPYVCDPLDPHIFLANNSMDPIMFISQSYYLSL